MAYSLEGLPDNFFPHPLLSDQDGLVGICHTLTLERVLAAYHFGIFPWYSAPYPIQWYFTKPRFVLFLEDFKISKSMRNVINKKTFDERFDYDFDSVILQCATVKRKGQSGTWIGDDMIDIYCRLHKMGYARCVETYRDEALVGGLYGLGLGQLFFGESMFTLQNNASKFALIKLVENLKADGYLLIDCQQETEHLRSLGAKMISGEIFWDIIKNNLLEILRTK